MPKLRILVSGMDYNPNQLTRAIEAYGCEALHVNGDPGTNFPRFADAVVVAKKVSSHQKMWQVKEAYKAMNKPIFHTGSGFSEIRGDFEKFLQSKGKLNAAINVVETNGLKVPSNWVTEKAPTKVLDTPKLDETSLTNLMQTKPQEKNVATDAKTRIKQLRDANRSAVDIADIINKEGYRKPRKGDKWKPQDIYNLVADWRKKAEKEAKAAKITVKSTEKSPPPTTNASLLDLINKVTGSQEITNEEKLATIARIGKGEIVRDSFTEKTVVDGILMLEQTDISRSSKNNPHVHLTKDQAELVLSNLEAIHKFIQGSL